MWVSIRHIIKNGPVYEERVSLWEVPCEKEPAKETPDFEMAKALARKEAEEYCGSLYEAVVLDFYQLFWMFDPPTSGSEVFSWIRDSDLSPEQYIDTFFDTPGERTVRD